MLAAIKKFVGPTIHILARVAGAFDLADVIFIAGFLLFGAGLWLYSPALALAASGALLIIIWLVPYLRGVRGG